MVLYKNKKRPRHMNADDYLNHKRELSRRSSLAYYHRNKERINNLVKENKENKEFIDKIKNYRKTYYQLNKEKIKQRTRDYYNKHLRKKKWVVKISPEMAYQINRLNDIVNKDK